MPSTNRQVRKGRPKALASFRPAVAAGISAAVLTVSDSCSRAEKTDVSGPAVARSLIASGFRVVLTRIIPDNLLTIQNTLLDLVPQVRLVVTTGGTGVAPRDVTPEATRAVCDFLIDGIAETMRREGAQKTPFAALSRAICGVCGKSVVLNLPGSPKGALDSLGAVVHLIPHALDLLDGNNRHD